MLLGILSDAHGHGRALSLGLELLRNQGVDVTFFLGDAVGYFPSSSVVKILVAQKSRIRCVRGNHEQMLLLGGVATDRESIYKLEEVRPLLSDDETEYLQSWPISIEETIDDQLILFVHGTRENPTFGYLYPDENVEATDGKYRVIFQGNTHWPMSRKVGDTLIVNPGSCSMPRDNGSFGSVATYDTETSKVRILRFSIEVANVELLKEFPETAPEVIALFSRDRRDFVGELIK